MPERPHLAFGVSAVKSVTEHAVGSGPVFELQNILDQQRRFGTEDSGPQDALATIGPGLVTHRAEEVATDELEEVSCQASTQVVVDSDLAAVPEFPVRLPS